MNKIPCSNPEIHMLFEHGFYLDNIVSVRKHFSNTDLSDLSIVGTCDIFVYQMRHKVILVFPIKRNSRGEHPAALKFPPAALKLPPPALIFILI